MTDTKAEESARLDSEDSEEESGGQGAAHGLTTGLALLGAVALVAAAIIFWLGAGQSRDIMPGEGSPEAGFARDMIVHHAQAVDMALLLYDRTQDTALRAIALDIMLSQQAQIGQMQGWLYLWRLPIASPDLPMTWMGMPVRGRMPGMASEEQLAMLRAATGTEADRQFIQLMIPHHASGIHMAEEIINRTNVPAVRELATSILETQQREIDELERIAARLAGAPEG